MIAMRVDVLGDDGGLLAEHLAACGGAALGVRRRTSSHELAALVVVAAAGSAAPDADVVVPLDADPATTALQLWRGRLQPWTAVVSGERFDAGPAHLHDSDPEWPRLAERRLRRLQAVLGEAAQVDHIGSTSVPGLAAKAVVDLQVRLPELPSEAEVTRLLAPLGYVLAPGSRPDSPGVRRDARMPADPAGVADEAYAKRLLVAPDPLLPSVLHLRRGDSPFAAHVVAFRDWLRVHPEGRQRYEADKRRLEAVHATDGDYDDYTRGKSDLLRELAPTWATWAAARDSACSGSP